MLNHTISFVRHDDDEAQELTVGWEPETAQYMVVAALYATENDQGYVRRIGTPSEQVLDVRPATRFRREALWRIADEYRNQFENTDPLTGD